MDHFDPTYLVTLDEIYHAHWAARRRTRIAMLKRAFESLWPQGHPSRLLQITGTNGKGSVAHYLAQGFGASAPVGSWTGPHVFDYAERFHINGKQVTHGEITDVFRRRVQPLQDRTNGSSFTFAELGILLALCLFEEKTCQWGVMEVGNGGRYTPLMGLPMVACVLTNVGNDHPKSLGEALWQRALEKAGIARAGVPFFTSATAEALEYVRLTAEAEGAPVTVIGKDEVARVKSLTAPNQAPHVYTNLALALAVLTHLMPEADPTALLSLMKDRLPARFWQKEPGVIVDMAHNAHKIQHLALELSGTFPNRRFHFVLGLTRSRDPLEVFAPLLPMAERITITSASHAGQDPEDVAERLRTRFAHIAVEKEPHLAYATAKRERGDNGIVVLTGSAYMIDQALNVNPYIRETNATYGRRYRQDGPPV